MFLEWAECRHFSKMNEYLGGREVCRLYTEEVAISGITAKLLCTDQMDLT